jgi:hypothetical protein
MADDLIYTEPVYTERAGAAIAAPTSADGQETDWSGWQRWLDGWLAIERQAIAETIAEALNELEAKRDQQVRELELKLAELTGALGVLRRGGAMRVCGTYSEGTRYEQHDLVAVDGSSFIAREDNPGRCPGAGWQLLASAGRRGARGFPGPNGERGEPGENATAEAGFMALHLDRKTYTIFLSTTDGRIHELSLRGLFEQFVSDMQGGR